MKLVRHSDIKWAYSGKHDMEAGVHADLPFNEAADVIFARIENGHTLPKHYHERPKDIDGSNNGYESFFFFRGGDIVLLLKECEQHIKSDEPFTLTFFSSEDEVHGIKNVGEEPVEFQVLCAPKFSETEEHFV
jgi:hypothetical protein